MLQQHGEAAVPHSQLLEHDALREHIDSETAVFDRNLKGAQAKRRSTLDEIERVDLVGVGDAVELQRLRANLLGSEFAGNALQLDLLLGQLKVHQSVPSCAFQRAKSSPVLVAAAALRKQAIGIEKISA